VVEDVLVNSIYGENQRVLAELLEAAGQAEAAARFRARAARTTQGLMEKSRDEATGLFFDLAGQREEPLRVSTVSSLMPLILPDLPAAAAQALIAHVEDPREYAAPWPVPSVAMSEPSFVPGVVGGKLLWRGAAWMNTNWYVSRGLRRHGRVDLARRIEDRSAELVERSGFFEYYDPFTGEGHGARDFSWTALVLDMLARHEGR
jgi:glycogen debranching enzyme